MAIPSLAMIPSGYKDGKVYSVLPTNGDGDFTFSRGSNATRVNKDGLIETMPLELGSELATNGSFDTDISWNKNSNWTISGGTANADGTSNGDMNQDDYNLPTAGSTYRIAFEITARTQGQVRIQYGNIATDFLYTLGKYEYILTTTSTDRLRIQCNNNFIGSIDNVSIKEVISGLDLPRLDYTDSSCPSLLLESQSTNLIPYSEDFSDSSWIKLGTSFTITSNNSISPSGLLNASTINVSNNDNILYKSIPSLSSSQSTWVFTIYAKGSGTFDMNIRLNSSTNIEETKTLTNDWQRFEVSATRTPTITSVEAYIELNTSSTYQIWGAQVEAGSYATSYIPTNGAIATRLADDCSNTSAGSAIGQTEGTLYAEAKINGLKNSNTIATLHNGSFSEYLVISGNSLGNINAYIFAGGVQQAGILSGIYAVDSIVKCAIAYKQNDVAFYINGVLIGTDSSATMANTSTFDVGSISFGDYPLHGSVKEARLYNTRLSNSELEELTK